MSRRFSATAIGAFVVGAIALVLVGLMLFGSGWLWRHQQVNVLYFSGSVKGLNIGSPVMFRGVKIGQVKDIRVICDTRDLTFRIPVLIETDLERIEAVGTGQEQGVRANRPDRFIQLLVQKGLRAQLQMQSLVTGQLFVQLDFFPDSKVRYLGRNEKYQEIPTVLSNFEEVSRTLQQIPLDQLVQKVMTTLDGIDKLVNDPELAGSIRSLNQALQGVKTLAGSIDKEMDRLSGSVAATMGKVSRLADHLDAQVVPVTGDLRGTLDTARQAFAQATRALDHVDSTLTPDSPERVALRQALQELAAAARSVRVLAEALELHPEMLLQGRKEGP